MSIDIKPNCKGSVEITDKDLLGRIAQSYGEQIIGIDINFAAEIYRIPGRVMTSDPADAYPEEVIDERRATAISVSASESINGVMVLDPVKDAKMWEIIETACDAEIYDAEVGVMWGYDDSTTSGYFFCYDVTPCPFFEVISTDGMKITKKARMKLGILAAQKRHSELRYRGASIKSKKLKYFREPKLLRQEAIIEQ